MKIIKIKKKNCPSKKKDLICQISYYSTGLDLCTYQCCHHSWRYQMWTMINSWINGSNAATLNCCHIYKCLQPNDSSILYVGCVRWRHCFILTPCSHHHHHHQIANKTLNQTFINWSDLNRPETILLNIISFTKLHWKMNL